MELKETCERLNEKIEELQSVKDRESQVVNSQVYEQNQIMLDQYESANSLLKERLEEMDEVAQKKQS